MGTILGSKMKGEGKVIFEVLLDYNEALHLHGNMHNIHLFSEDNADTKAVISSRGKRSSTKYFLVPREQRNDLAMEKEVTCQRIELKDKVIFVYIVEKR